MDIIKFSEKLNKVDGNVYTIEEVVTPIDGIYEADLEHDNINTNTLNIYTGSKLTGDKINTYTISTPSLTPWRTHIKIFSDISQLYISYETIGDTVEADDINNVQNAINLTQEELNNETSRAEQAETLLQQNIDNETDRAKKAESYEVTRAQNAESTLQNNIDAEVQRATNKEAEIDTALADRYTKQETFTRDEVLQKIQDVIGTAPEALDTLQEIAKALNDDSDFAGTMTTELSKKADKGHTHTKSEIEDMPTKVSQFTNDAGYITASDIDTSQNHTHSNKTALDKITQNNIDVSTIEDLTGKTFDANDATLSSGEFLQKHYRERTNAGASNITNIPLSSRPFLLDVYLIRFIDNTDYITLQRFKDSNSTDTYERVCVSGTWKNWYKIYNSNNLTKVSQLTNDAGYLAKGVTYGQLKGV